MTRKSRSLNSFVNKPYCEIAKADMKKLNIQNGDKIKVTSRRGEIELDAKESVMPSEGFIFIPFHFSEAVVNKLTLDKLDPIAKYRNTRSAQLKLKKYKKFD